MVRLVTSGYAAARLEAARRFVFDASPASEILIVSASRGKPGTSRDGGTGSW